MAVIGSATAASLTAGSSQSGTVSPRLHEAAVQFEAMLLKDLLKPLAESAGMGGAEGGEQTGALQSFAVDAIAGTMAKSGALGFAKQIEQTVAQGAAKHFSQGR
ncbi:hypothetical protein [Terriglobus sp.]|uniref:hypothetical protein n=1 Tax=Terriglobus sp. TaxID=1889013 RepID=UPI003AFF9FA1